MVAPDVPTIRAPASSRPPTGLPPSQRSSLRSQVSSSKSCAHEPDVLVVRPGSAASGRSGCSRRSASSSAAASGRSAHSGCSRRSSSSAGACSQRSEVGELPRPAPFIVKAPKWQVPTRENLGDDQRSCGSSDISSVRTATTIREYFEEERRWAGATPAGHGHRLRQAPPRMPSVAEAGPIGCGYSGGVSPAAAASVLPGNPIGKVPGGRNDWLYKPRPMSGMAW
eukprot:gnl/TRDRNA2_/TRDRNA2_43706_c0_seq1.p1 gnl/TRDRNA2_/TRDRNA2_43706_c0~~gnl/TRDRNA2_/TRDRNA2_43706_c0_seq1.p1  ORF type:complete len:248 (+),score=27.27 gnl/TRDRNA2_/TRDRNA2_43706_c0_seq1:71-745(+)